MSSSSSSPSSSSIQPTYPPRFLADSARAAASKGVYYEGFKDRLIQVKDEHGQVQNKQRPEYTWAIPRNPIPNRRPDLSMSLETYRSTPLHKFYDLSTGDFNENDEIRNLSLDLIRENAELWTKRGVRVLRQQWEEIAVEVYLRKGKLLRVNCLRGLFRNGKDYLRKKLKECIIEKKLNGIETEEFFMKHYPGYIHIRFFRTALAPYEEQLRNKYSGLEADEEEIRSFENDEDIIIESEEIVNRGVNLAVSLVKTEQGPSGNNQQSSNGAPPPPPRFYPVPINPIVTSAPSFPFPFPFPPRHYYHPQNAAPIPFYSQNAFPVPIHPPNFMLPTSGPLVRSEQDMKVHQLSQLQHLQYGPRSSLAPVDTSSPQESANNNPIHSEDSHQVEPVVEPNDIPDLDNAPPANRGPKDREEMIARAKEIGTRIIQGLQKKPHSRDVNRQSFYEFISLMEEVPYKKIIHAWEDCDRSARNKRRITENRLKTDQDTKRPRREPVA